MKAQPDQQLMMVGVSHFSPFPLMTDKNGGGGDVALHCTYAHQHNLTSTLLTLNSGNLDHCFTLSCILLCWLENSLGDVPTGLIYFRHN